jgi:hypothetical protein
MPSSPQVGVLLGQSQTAVWIASGHFDLHDTIVYDSCILSVNICLYAAAIFSVHVERPHHLTTYMCTLLPGSRPDDSSSQSSFSCQFPLPLLFLLKMDLDLRDMFSERPWLDLVLEHLVDLGRRPLRHLREDIPADGARQNTDRSEAKEG